MKIASKTIEEEKIVKAIIYYKPIEIHGKMYYEIPSICEQTNSIHLTEISREDRILVPTRYWLSVNSNVNFNYINKRRCACQQGFMHLITDWRIKIGILHMGDI